MQSMRSHLFNQSITYARRSACASLLRVENKGTKLSENTRSLHYTRCTAMNGAVSAAECMQNVLGIVFT